MEVVYMKLELVKHPSDWLSKKLDPWDFDNPPMDPVELKAEMLKLMKANLGIGLSANQVGMDMAVFVIGDGQIDGMQKAFFNPMIIGVGDETDSMKEGCLSFPGVWLMVNRPKQAMI